MKPKETSQDALPQALGFKAIRTMFPSKIFHPMLDRPDPKCTFLKIIIGTFTDGVKGRRKLLDLCGNQKLDNSNFELIWSQDDHKVFSRRLPKLSTIRLGHSIVFDKATL